MDRKPCLLIVDDEQSILDTLQLIFEHDGYRVVTAQSCAEALSLFDEQHKFDAVLTDLNMEKEDIGLEVARAAKNLKPRPAIVVFTGFANSSNTRAAFEIGVDYMTPKPVEPRDLTAALRRLIVRRTESQNPK